MEIREAVCVLRGIYDSLKSQSRQFHFEVHVSGQHLEVSGGTGTINTTIGGAAGSSTVGQIVSLNNAQVKIAQEKGVQVLNEKMNGLLDAIKFIADQLESQKPDKNCIETIYNSLKNTWVPGVITSVIGNLLSSIVL